MLQIGNAFEIDSEIGISKSQRWGDTSQERYA